MIIEAQIKALFFNNGLRAENSVTRRISYLYYLKILGKVFSDPKLPS